jgi:hypothetical protein
MKLSRQFKEDIANAAQVEETIYRRPYTIATVTMEYESRIIVAAGLAICGKRDVWSEDLGGAIAIGRAKHNLAKKIAAIQMRQTAVSVQPEDPCKVHWGISRSITVHKMEE